MKLKLKSRGWEVPPLGLGVLVAKGRAAGLHAEISAAEHPAETSPGRAGISQPPLTAGAAGIPAGDCAALGSCTAPDTCQLCLCWSCLPSSESQRCASACCDGIFLHIAPKPLLFGKMLISSKLMVDLEASKQPLQSPFVAPALPELRCDLLAGVALY